MITFFRGPENEVPVRDSVLYLLATSPWNPYPQESSHRTERPGESATLSQPNKPVMHMSVFFTDSVTIVRKKGDWYEKEEINTAPVLPGANVGKDRIRAGVIARLRKDPSVLLVLEDRDGKADERVSLPDGFEMAVSLVDGDTPSGSLTVFHRGEKVYEEEFTQDSAEDEPQTVQGDLLETVIDLASDIENKDYSFVSDESTHFTAVEPGEEVGLHDARRILEEAGFQTESVYMVGFLSEPLLFVHENDVILLGSRRFDGRTLYLEMKRLFYGVDRKSVARAVEMVREDCRPVEIFECGDGSWSFRGEMDDDVDADNFLDRLESDVAVLRKAVARVEECEGVGGEPWSIMREQRQLFIHEVIDASVKLKALNI